MAFCVSPDESLVLTCATSAVALNDASTGDPRANIYINKQVLSGTLAGDKICVGIADKTCRVYDKKGALLKTIEGFPSPVVTMSAASESVVVCGLEDGSLRSFDAKTGAFLSDGLQSISLSKIVASSARPTRSVFVVDPEADDHRVYVRESKSCAEVAALSGHSGKVLVAILVDDTTVVSAGEDGEVRVWNLLNVQRGANVDLQDGPVDMIASSGTELTATAAANGRRFVIWQDGEILRKVIAEKEDNTSTFAPGTLAVSPDGLHVGIAWMDKKLTVFDAVSGEERYTSAVTTEQIKGLAFTRGLSLIVVGVQNVYILDSANGTVQRKFILTAARDNFASRAAFSPDLSKLVVCMTKGIQVHSIETGQNITTQALEKHGRKLHSLSVFPNGEQVLSAEENSESIVVWDINKAGGNDELALDGIDSTCTGISKDGDFVLIGYKSGNISIWNIRFQSEILHAVSRFFSFNWRHDLLLITCRKFLLLLPSHCPHPFHYLNFFRKRTRRRWCAARRQRLRVCSGSSREAPTVT